MTLVLDQLSPNRNPASRLPLRVRMMTHSAKPANGIANKMLRVAPVMQSSERDEPSSFTALVFMTFFPMLCPSRIGRLSLVRMTRPQARYGRKADPVMVPTMKATVPATRAPMSAPRKRFTRSVSTTLDADVGDSYFLTPGTFGLSMYTEITGGFTGGVVLIVGFGMKSPFSLIPPSEHDGMGLVEF